MEIKRKIKEFGEEFGSTEKLEKAINLISSGCKKNEIDEEEYLQNYFEIANNLVKLKLGQEAVIAALIYRLVKIEPNKKEIEKEFGKKVLQIIEQKITLEKALLFKPHNMENSRKKLLIVLSTNPEVVILQLSEMLEKLRNINKISKNRRNELIVQIKEIYAPLAHKIGLYSFSSEMYDLVFLFQKPEEYSRIKKEIAETLSEMENDIQKIKKAINSSFKEAGIDSSISGRIKSIYSTYLKMHNKKVGIKKITDLIALRIVTNSSKECYEVLGIIHSLWKPILGGFDDYITKPKNNGYQSLHTAVISSNNNPVEFQIRTKEMHDLAEYGIASHWQYKGEKGDKKFDQKIDWIKQVLEWKKISGEKTDTAIFGKEIFALTPKGQVIELPEGATTLDFAYAIHTDVGSKCQNVKVNGRIASLNAVLTTGDVVEITTSHKQKPKIGWLGFVKTQKAKQKIKVSLQLQSKKTRGMQPSGQVLKTSHQKIKLAKCCAPLPGDKIVGLKTTKRKISVHRTDCPEIKKISGEKIIVDWHKKSVYYDTQLVVKSFDRVGLLKEILSIISANNIKVDSANTRLTSGKNVVCVFDLKLKNIDQLEETIDKINRVKGVTEVSKE